MKMVSPFPIRAVYIEKKESLSFVPDDREEFAMMVIQSHDVVLEKQISQGLLRLIPLRDDHLPYLYQWNQDPEVLYWAEADDVPMGYPPETVRAIYGGVSKNAICFLVLLNEFPIGECWLQKMNLPEVRNMYPASWDVRRIDLCIGEKAYWGQGIGTAMIGMLVEFAFCREQVDVLHCFTEDYNIRSGRAFEKNGFVLIRQDPVEGSPKCKAEYHWQLKKEWI